MKNSSVPELSTTSRYYAAEKQIIDLAVGNDNDGVKRMSAEEFAEKVASDVIGGANGKIWRGSYLSIARVFNVLVPAGVLVSLSSSLGLLSNLLIWYLCIGRYTVESRRGLDAL